jgi:hypothetical protein
MKRFLSLTVSEAFLLLVPVAASAPITRAMGAGSLLHHFADEAAGIFLPITPCCWVLNRCGRSMAIPVFQQSSKNSRIFVVIRSATVRLQDAFGSFLIRFLRPKRRKWPVAWRVNVTSPKYIFRNARPGFLI